MHYGRFPHTLPTDLPTYPSDTPFRHTLETPLRHTLPTNPSDIPWTHPSDIPSDQDLPKALVQGMPLYKGRGKSHVPIKKINVPIFRVSCPYRKNQCPYLFGQIYVIFCFNLGTKFASMICGSFLFHFQRRSMRHEADASAYTYNNYNTCLIYAPTYKTLQCTFF